MPHEQVKEKSILLTIRTVLFKQLNGAFQFHYEKFKTGKGNGTMR